GSILPYPPEHIVLRHRHPSAGRDVWLQQLLSGHEARSLRSEARFWRHDTLCFRSDSGDAPCQSSGLKVLRLKNKLICEEPVPEGERGSRLGNRDYFPNEPYSIGGSRNDNVPLFEN